MSLDDIDSLIVGLVDYLEDKKIVAPHLFDNDEIYEKFSEFVHFELEPFVTRDRNYN